MSMPKEQIAEAAESVLLSFPLQLADGVEIIQGANDQMMLYQPVKGTYVRLSALGVTVVKMLDGSVTGFDVIKRLEDLYPGQINISALVYHFFTDLRRSCVLNLEPEEEHGVKPLLRKVTKRPMLRLPLAKSADLFAGFFVRIAQSMPKTMLRLCILFGLIAAVGVIVAENHQFGLQPHFERVVWPLLIAALVLHLVLHEMSHAIVCLYFGIRIREAGVGLLYYFIPVAYVDRTDAYRLRKKSSRALIALAGPAYDLIAAGVWATVAFATDRAGWGETAHLIAMIELLMLIGNLNLLLPTDGYHAMEAATGELILRTRSLHYLFYVITRQPLPNSFVHVSHMRKWVYIVYAAVSSIYVLLVLSGFSFFVYTLSRM